MFLNIKEIGNFYKDLFGRNSWKDLIVAAVIKADWKKIRQDVEQFLENPQDLNILTRENIIGLLK